MDISIVIPTFNRSRILRRVLDSLYLQSYPRDRYEIVVVDDGSTDDTRRTLPSIREEAPCQLNYIEQDKRGPAAARNLGVRTANGDIILFLGDDIVARKDLLREHMNFQDEFEREAAVLGHTVWPPDMKVTPFMRYIGEFGDQFGYRFVSDREELPCTFFYTSNLSVRRATLLDNGLFDEDFRHAAYEDVELGLRLQKKGLRLVFNKNAVAYHYHPTTPSLFYRRQFLAGVSAAAVCRKHPEARDVIFGNLPYGNPVKWFGKRLILPSIALMLNLLDQRNRSFPERRYRQILDYYFWRGYRTGARDLKQR